MSLFCDAHLTTTRTGSVSPLSLRPNRSSLFTCPTHQNCTTSQKGFKGRVFDVSLSALDSIVVGGPNGAAGGEGIGVHLIGWQTECSVKKECFMELKYIMNYHVTPNKMSCLILDLDFLHTIADP